MLVAVAIPTFMLLMVIGPSKVSFLFALDMKVLELSSQ
jgi:hypothetical protein